MKMTQELLTRRVARVKRNWSRVVALVATTSALTFAFSGSAAAQNAGVLCVQEELTARGQDPGPLDGSMGARTRAASVAVAASEGLTLPALATANAETWCSALRPWHHLSAEANRVVEGFPRSPLAKGTVGMAPLFQWPVGATSQSHTIRPGDARAEVRLEVLAVGDDGYYETLNSNGNRMHWRGDIPYYGTNFNPQQELVQRVTWDEDILGIFPLEIGRSSRAHFSAERPASTPYEGNRYCEVLSEEEVSLPNAATYQTYHIACADTYGPEDPTAPRYEMARVHHYWYAPSASDVVLSVRDNEGAFDAMFWREEPFGR